jgi:hypothetical protein
LRPRSRSRETRARCRWPFRARTSQLFFCEIGSQITGTFSADGETFEGNALFVVEQASLEKMVFRGVATVCALKRDGTQLTCR